MSNITVFVINGDQETVLNSLNEVFNVKKTSTPSQSKNYYLTSLQTKHANKYLKENDLLIFNEFADSFTHTYNKRPSNVNLIRYLQDKGYVKLKRIVSNRVQNYWTKK